MYDVNFFDIPEDGVSLFLQFEWSNCNLFNEMLKLKEIRLKILQQKVLKSVKYTNSFHSLKVVWVFGAPPVILCIKSFCFNINAICTAKVQLKALKKRNSTLWSFPYSSLRTKNISLGTFVNCGKVWNFRKRFRDFVKLNEVYLGDAF